MQVQLLGGNCSVPLEHGVRGRWSGLWFHGGALWHGCRFQLFGGNCSLAWCRFQLLGSNCSVPRGMVFVDAGLVVELSGLRVGPWHDRWFSQLHP